MLAKDDEAVLFSLVSLERGMGNSLRRKKTIKLLAIAPMMTHHNSREI